MKKNIYATQGALTRTGVFAGISLAAALAAFTFTACGDETNSGNGENTSAFKEVNTIEDLGNCNKNKFGEIVYVAETDSLYECGSNGWASIDSSEVADLLSSSSGDEKPGSSDAKSSSSFKVDSSDVAEVEIVKIDSITVTGVAQKGPFASGSSVTVYGLDSLYNTTKTKFTGKVAGDSGAFKVEKIVLPSQFALVQVAGFYTNEVTGKKTSGTKTTLNAIVDLSEGKSVTANVNVLTELEYARVKYLVEKEKFNVPAAKKRATAELLKLFGTAGADEKSEISATSISLSDTNAAGLALLSASILLQGDLSASKFGSRLSEIAGLFAETGALDSAELRADLADWASMVDSTDNFESIRNNVKALKLAAKVPDFESVLYAFWTKEYGLGECTADLEETLEKNTNKNSDNYGVGYACTSKRWHKSTALDTDLGLCTAKMEGSFKERKQEKKDSEFYVCRAGTWNAITAIQFELKECTEERELEYVKTKSEEYFVCSAKQWKDIDAIDYELKLCTEKRSKEFAKTEKSGNYVCEWDGDAGTWRKATELEAELGVCGGNSVKADSIYKTKDGAYYQCSESEWGKSDQLSYEMQDAGECTEKNDQKVFKTETLGYYVCIDKAWREATDLEVELGVCGTKNSPAGVIKKTSDEAYYQCSESEWKKSDQLSYELQTAGECSDKNDLSTFETATLGQYVCDNGKWREAETLEAKLGVCGDKNNPDNTFKQDSTDEYYVCLNKAWKSVDAVSYELNELCDASNENAYRSAKSGYYACLETDDVLQWNKVTKLDYEFKMVCNESNLRKKQKSSAGLYYECETKGWTNINAFVDSRDGQIYKYVEMFGKTWMAENLNYRYVVKQNKALHDYDTSSYCYNNSPDSCAKYGRLYRWSAAMDSAGQTGCGYYTTCSQVSAYVRGICPSGWRLPTVKEVDSLYTRSYSYMGKYLKSTSGWDNYNGASGNGTDDYGFDAMPAGYASYGSYTTKGIGQYADFWTSSEYSSQAANYMEMRYKDGRLYSLDARKDNAFSVRCIKNK